MIKMGHRGAKGIEPENTLISFKEGMKYNCDYLELDVRLTKDKELVLMHDVSVRRMTNGRGLVRKKTLKEIKKLKIKRKNQKIPTLQEVVDLTKGKIKLNIEIKDRNAGEKVGELIKKNKIASKTMVSSNYITPLVEVKKIAPKTRTALIYYSYQKKWQMFFMAVYNLIFWPFVKRRIIRKARKAKADDINLFYMFATKPHVDMIKENGFGVNVWTVNEKDELKKLIKNGIDGYVTDYPDRL